LNKEKKGDFSFASSMDADKLPAKLQRKLTESGVPFRTGGRDITWKYQLYPTAVQKQKPACLGLPVKQLLQAWSKYKMEVGQAVGQLISPDLAIADPEPQKVENLPGIQEEEA